MEESIIIECEHLVSVPKCLGVAVQVIFNPTRETVDRVYEWQAAQEFVIIKVEDRAGYHSSNQKHLAIDITFDYNTMVVETMTK